MKIFPFLLLTISAAAQPAALSLDDAIRTAWANDPAVAAIALLPELARARETQAGLRPNPALEVRSSVPAKGDSEWSMGVGVTQQIPRRERVELARAMPGWAESRPHWNCANAAACSPGRFAACGMIRRCSTPGCNRRSAPWRCSRKSPGRCRAAARPGEVADAEWALLQLELARAEHAVTVAQAEVTGGQERLRRRLRLSAETPLSISADLDELIDRAFPSARDLSTARPELALADWDVRRAAAALALARGESRADWSVGAGVDFERRTNDATGRLEQEPRLSVSASVPWPGGRLANQGDILERQAALQIAESTLQARRDELGAEFGAAVAAGRAAQPAVQRYRTLLQSAAELPRQLAPAYARGEVTAFQLAQARQQHLAIEAEFLAAAARYLSILAEAETAAGLIPAQP
jgi:cobalt-zinc-cadmium efflux system outer membrane protein